MIVLNNAALRRGPKLLFKDINLTVFPGKRIGIVGINGSGKSSLFAMFLKELALEAGDINYQNNLKIGYLAQEMPNSLLTALEYTMEGDVEMSQLFKEVDHAEKIKNYQLAAKLHTKLYETNCYAIKAKAAKILAGLGFEESVHCKKVNEFSGGWRMRLNLAKVLMCRSDLILLDEPTNHLDLDAIVWLEKWLKSHDATIMLISHDREFLDKTVQLIWHIDQNNITSYTGNYTNFETNYAQKLSQQQALQKKQQEKITHMMSFINRFRAKATKAKQAQSRLKALGKLEKSAEIHFHKPINFEFCEYGKITSSLIKFDQVTFAYEKSILLLDKINFAIAAGERIGLLGKNGIGKTTLVKMIVGKLNPVNGNIIKNNKLRIGYFAQHQMEQLTLSDTPLQHFVNLDQKISEKELRNFLGSFGFSNEMAVTAIKNFSGGEKARLVLAMLVFQKPNLLLLDEPTNHLDLEMRESLSLALQTFSGALLVVSHDRYLLNTVADEFWLIHDKKVIKFAGDLNDYEHYLMRNSLPKKSILPEKNIHMQSTKVNDDLQMVEKLLKEKYKQQKALETTICSTNKEDNLQLFANLLDQYSKIENKIKNLEEKWIKLNTT
jgi:ATP-binding cassette, subfamily F, member 3